jgi:Protein of unknown function (DUF3014)
MADFDDFKLDKWETSFHPERSGFAWRVVAIIVVLLGLGAAGYFLLWRRASPNPTDVRVHTDQAVPAPATAPVAEAAPSDLPPLEQTDTLVRDLVGKLSSHPTIAAWLTTDHLIRNFTVAVVNTSSGRTPANQLARIRPTESFQIIQRGSDTWIDPRSYRRYDRYADAVSGLDANGAAQLYTRLKPRIQDAYRELGYPDGNVDAALQRAVTEILATPVVEGNVRLTPKSVAYEFADPRLQSLSSAQRQLLRMGPRNVRLIQAKLREIAPLIGVDIQPKP